MRIEITDLNDIKRAASTFLKKMGHNKVFAFYGSMGAGKTTFIKALCEEIGVTETVSSPTFAIINEYRDKEGRPIFHFDFYRINKLEEAFDFGYEDYFYSGNLCFIEWPELVESLLPQDAVKIEIRVTEGGRRILESKP